MDKTPLVSVIIVNYNGRIHLEKCLSSLMSNRYQKYEVILIDNDSTDSSVEFIEENYPAVNIIKLDGNHGFAEPNNIGARQANGEFLLFLNNDTIADPDFLIELVKVSTQDPKIAICQSLLLKPDGSVDSSGDFVDKYGRAYSSRKKITKVQPILSARGASMMVRKEAFWDLGGFDKNFYVSFEDVDIGWRAWLWGYEVFLAPKSIVYHIGRQTIQKMDSIISFHAVKNTLLLRLVNFETFYAVRSITVLYFVSFMRKFFGISVIKDPEQAPPLPSFKIIFRGIIWITKNFKYLVKKRKVVNSRRIRSTQDLIELGLITR